MDTKSETTKRIRTEICNIISDMLDNPGECEIYPTTKCYDALEKFIHQEVIRGKIEAHKMYVLPDVAADIKAKRRIADLQRQIKE